MTDYGKPERDKYIFVRSKSGIGENLGRVTLWWHGLERNSIYALMALTILFLFASNMDYRDQLNAQASRAEQREQELAIASQYKRSEPVVFVLPANDLDQYRQRLRDVRNVANDQLEFAKSAQK